MTAGAAAFNLTVNGANFTGQSSVRWNGSPRSTTLLSANALQAAISAGDVASAGTASVTVFDTVGGTSNAATFTISAAPVPPSISSLSPSSVTAGAAAFNLTVNGANFTGQSSVRWNGSPRSTTLLSANSLQAAISAADVTTAGTASITVNDTTGGTSNAATFTISAAPVPPSITSLSPPSVTTGAAAFNLTVNGANFTAQSTVRWNGSPRTTTLLSANAVRAAINSADVAATGTASITVNDTTGGTSNAATFTISAAPVPPAISSLSPSSVTAGSAAFNLTVNGANFTAQSTVRWNGSARATALLSSNAVMATILATDVQGAGTAAVDVVDTQGGTSNAAAFAITAAPVLPGTPASPTPSNGASGVSTSPTLSWTAATATLSYDLYFGTASNPAFALNTTNTSVAPGALAASTTYFWRVVARNAVGMTTSPIWSFTTAGVTPPSSGLRFVPITPCRIMDTRAGQGTTGSFGPPTFAAGTSRDVPVPAGPCGIPSTAKAYSFNATVVPTEPLAYLSLWPTGVAQPQVSTLNSFHGGIVANAAIVPAGTNGSVSVFATNRTDVILDINGYFDSAAGGYSFYATDPCRAADTRSGSGFTGAYGPPILPAAGVRDLPLPASLCAMPAAKAYSLNVTVVPPAPLSFLTAWAAGTPKPFVSTLNSFDGAIVANAAIVPASAQGAVSLYVTDASHAIVDTNGYFNNAGGAGELLFYPVTPCRAFDSRVAGQGAPIMGALEKRDAAIGGKCGIPADAKALSINATVVPPAPLSFLTLWPAGKGQPQVSTLNSFLGRVVANAAIVPTGANASVSLFTTDATHVILDVNGYFR